MLIYSDPIHIPTAVNAASPEVLRAFIVAVLEALYFTGPDTEWSADTLDAIGRAANVAGLAPTEKGNRS